MIPTINLEECDQSVQSFFAMLGDKSTVILYKNGKPCYFFGEIDEFQAEVASLSNNQNFMDYLAQCRQRSKTQGTLSFAEVKHRLAGIDSAEANPDAG